MTHRPDSATEQIRVRCRDGVRLATDVYLPGARSARVPAVLVRTPYGKDAPDSLLPFIAARLAGAGYAVVVQDVRGRGASGGVAVPFVHELYDAVDTLDWLVAQGWSDGQVACWGNSYYGFTAWAAAASGHPAVRALVSRYTSSHPSSFTHDGGVLRLGPMVEWLNSTWSGSATPEPALGWSTRPLGALLSASHRVALADRWELRERIGRTFGAASGRVPTLHCVGWFDLFQRAQLREWCAASASPAQFLIASASDHMDDAWSATGASADQLVDSAARDAMLERTVAPVVEFLDLHLKGLASQLSCVRWELAGGTWDDAPVWPPVGARPHIFRLCGPGADGALCDDTRTPDGSVRWEHDPDDLVPMTDTDWWRPLLRQGDARDWLGRAAVCSFTGDPVSAPLVLAGPVTLRLAVGSTAPVHHLIATLCDVAPDGTSRVILQAAQRLPGDRRQVVVTLGGTGYRLPTEHRLRLHLTSSCFPLYLPHSGSGADPLTADRLTGSRQELDAASARLTITLRPHLADRKAP